MIQARSINYKQEDNVKKMAYTAAMLLVLAAQMAGNPTMDPQQDIQKLLENQVAAWNRADFVGFMETYWNSPELTYQSGSQRHTGWKTLLDRYQTNYAGDKAGRLSFDDVKITILAPDLALVLGRFHLEYPDSPKHGIFTLILRKFPQGWLIIHDHSSS